MAEKTAQDLISNVMNDSSLQSYFRNQFNAGFGNIHGGVAAQGGQLNGLADGSRAFYANHFISAYQEQTGKLPTDAQVKSFLTSVIKPDVAVQYIQGTQGDEFKSQIVIPYIQSNFKNQLLPDQAAIDAKQAEADKLAKQEQLAASQREQSAQLLQQGMEALTTPFPQFTPELSEAVLTNLQNQVLRQGQSDISGVSAGMAKRGLSGSSIEQFGLTQSAKNTADTLTNATLNFLLQSGTAGQQNREFIANQLFNQAQVLLGAGQQSGAQATSLDLGQQQMSLNRDQLAAQIAQFNTQMQESRRQFEQNLSYQQQQAQQNLSLMSNYINQSNKGMGIGDILGLTFQGLGTLGQVGMGLGALKKK